VFVSLGCFSESSCGTSQDQDSARVGARDMRCDSFSAYLEAPQRLKKQGISRAASELVTGLSILSGAGGIHVVRAVLVAGSARQTLMQLVLEHAALRTLLITSSSCMQHRPSSTVSTELT
jgi:hypothetical protein